MKNIELEAFKKSALESRDAGRPLTHEELAWFWRVNPQTILRWTRLGVLKSIAPSVKTPRYNPEIILKLHEIEEKAYKAGQRRSLKIEETQKTSRSRKNKKRERICLL